MGKHIRFLYMGCIMSFVFVIIQDLALSNKYFSDWSGFGNHSKRNN